MAARPTIPRDRSRPRPSPQATIEPTRRSLHRKPMTPVSNVLTCSGMRESRSTAASSKRHDTEVGNSIHYRGESGFYAWLTWVQVRPVLSFMHRPHPASVFLGRTLVRNAQPAPNGAACPLPSKGLRCETCTFDSDQQNAPPMRRFLSPAACEAWQRDPEQQRHEPKPDAIHQTQHRISDKGLVWRTRTDLSADVQACTHDHE